MNISKLVRKSIANDIESLEEICKRTGYCKDCVAYQSADGLKIRDFIGCPFTNYVIRRTEDYQHKKGYDRALDSSLIDLTFHSMVEAVMSKDHMPNKKDILTDLNQLKIILREKEEAEEDIELTIPEEPEIHTISRKAEELL
jgi:hypothetical protein